jgi:hypothetical protein
MAAGSRSLTEPLCSEAVATTGLTDFGDDWFREPLAAWAEDLQQPNLTEFGVTFLRNLVERDLVRRLRVVATLREHPEIAEVPIPPILYVTGLERSGTTLLHNLAALHPEARALRRWELMEPLPPPTTATYESDPRIAKIQASVDRRRGSAYEAMHWVNAADPEECVWGFIDSVSMMGQSPTVWMPRWRQFLNEEDQTPAFLNYRRIIQLLLWKHPVGPAGFLVLKAPQIARHIPEFAAAFPEAHFVMADRDPYRCIVSLAVLGAGLAAPFCKDNPMTQDGRRRHLAQSIASPKLDVLTTFSASWPGRITHVPYPLLVNDPVAALELVFADWPMSGPPRHEAVTAFLDAQHAGTRPAPPGELDSMGYELDEVWADPNVAAYCDRYGVVPEHTRLTGSKGAGQ